VYRLAERSICAAPSLCVQHDSCICVTWLSICGTCLIDMRHAVCSYVLGLCIHVWDMQYARVCWDYVSTCGTCLIDMRNITYARVRWDYVTCVTMHVHVYGVMHSYYACAVEYVCVATYASYHFHTTACIREYTNLHTRNTHPHPHTCTERDSPSPPAPPQPPNPTHTHAHKHSLSLTP